jgi:hypothetical protein
MLVGILRFNFLNRLQQNVARDQDKRRQADYEDRIKKVFTHDTSKRKSETGRRQH